jgi:hypothetical protein
MTGDTARLELVGHLLAELVQAQALRGGPRLIRPGDLPRVIEPGEEALECRVQKGAAFGRAHLEQLLRLLDRVDAQEALHEVAVRTSDPALERRRRDDAQPVGRVRELVAAGREVPVEAGERVAHPAVEQRPPKDERRVGAGLGRGCRAGRCGQRLLAPLLLRRRSAWSTEVAYEGLPTIGCRGDVLPGRDGQIRPAGERAQRGQQPAARQAVPAAPQVAARERRIDGRRGGEGCQQLPALDVEAFAQTRQLSRRRLAGVIGEERVLGLTGRAEALGEPDDEDAIDVEADGRGQRRDQHPDP